MPLLQVQFGHIRHYYGDVTHVSSVWMVSFIQILDKVFYFFTYHQCQA